MSPRHGRNKPKPTLTGEAAAHQARVERARYSYDRIVVTETCFACNGHGIASTGDVAMPCHVCDGTGGITDDPEAEHWGRFWGDPEGSRP